MPEITSRLSAALANRYRIARRLGEGGMATVYLAEDLKHRRKVAVKVLRPELAAILGAERFLKEIEVTANLQHPNILPLYDSGEADSFLYYVMPFVDGETLRQRLEARKQLGIGEALEIAQSVAGALDYAHRQAVVHRDVKPENVLLYEGQALVADFGIALAVSQAGGSRITETGLSIGTPHYMSPEQAAADRTLDGRTDIYALGAMTYEMLVGRPPFEAASTQAVLSKILTAPTPRVSTERPAVPSHVDAAVHVALSKLPADRFSTAAQFADSLANTGFAIPGSDARTRRKTVGLSRYIWPAVVVGSLVLAWAGWHRPVAGRVERVHLDLPEGQRLFFAGGGADVFDLSQDGTKLVYQADSGGGSQLYLREMDSFSPRALEGTAGARHQFFSPDGEWIGFFADGSLQRVSVHGGAPIEIANAPGNSHGASWGPDDRILYALEGTLYLVTASGSTPVEIPLDAQSEGRVDDEASVAVSGGSPRWPHILPDGAHALVTTGAGTIAVDLNSFDVKYVFAGGQAQYLPTGHLIYHAGQERVRVVPFDVDRLEVTGSEIPVVDNVFRGPDGGAANFAVAPRTGTLMYLQGSFNRRLVLVDRNGRRSLIPAEPRGYRFPEVSPNGRYLAVTVDPRPSDLWIVDIERGSAERQQTDAHDGWGVWSPDGARVAFVRAGGDEEAPLGWLRYPFVSPPTPIMRSSNVSTWLREWTTDDRLVAQTGQDIVAVSIRDGAVEPLIATPAVEKSPDLSPDGRWMAFASDVSGTFEVYVHGYPEPGERHTVSIGGGTDPRWAWDGSELYYRNGDAILAVQVHSGTTFEVLGPPEELFTGSYDFTQASNWTVHPDGRFIMVLGDLTTTTRFHVVLNWLEELKGQSR